MVKVESYTSHLNQAVGPFEGLFGMENGIDCRGGGYGGVSFVAYDYIAAEGLQGSYEIEKPREINTSSYIDGFKWKSRKIIK
jgi:hypothetical protein